MIHVGIDPGSDGAIGIIDEKYDKYYVYDMPKRRGRELFLILRPYRYLDIHVTIEVSRFPGNTGSSTFLVNLGVVKGVLEALNYPYIEVYPLTWKKEFDLNKKKGEIETGTKSKIEYKRKLKSVHAAEKLFPNVQYYTERGRMLDGRADAMLLAEYGRRIIKQGGQDGRQQYEQRRKKKGGDGD